MSYITHQAPEGAPRHGVDFVSQTECPICRPGVTEAMRLLFVELSQEMVARLRNHSDVPEEFEALRKRWAR